MIARKFSVLSIRAFWSARSTASSNFIISCRHPWPHLPVVLPPCQPGGGREAVCALPRPHPPSLRHTYQQGGGHCTLIIAHYMMHTAHYTLYTAHCTVLIDSFTQHTIQTTWWTTHYTLPIKCKTRRTTHCKLNTLLPTDCTLYTFNYSLRVTHCTYRVKD